MSVPNPLGCDKNIDGDQLAALKNISPDDMKALINSHAGSEGCKNEIRNSLDTAVSRGQTMDTWLRDSATVSGSLGWSGGSASAGVSMDVGLSTTDTNLSTERTTMSGISSGCRQTLMNMNESNSLYSQMTCNIKQVSNTAASDIRIGATISVRVGPTDGQVAAYDRKVAGINDNIARLLNRTDMNEFTIKSLAILNEALEKADAGFKFDITNSSFKINSTNVSKLISTNNQQIENNSQIREAILKKATSEAITGVTQKFEMGAQASQDLEAYASAKINDTSLSTTQEIVQAANDTKLNVDMNGNVTLNINGSLDGTNVDITQGNLTEMRSELIMKSASELGKDVAAEIIHEALTKGSIDTEGTGLASYQKAIADGLAEQAKNLKPSGGGGLFGGLFGGMIGKIAMIVIPIIIILVLFSMFGFKIALVAGLIFGIYLAIAYFVGLTPFSKEKNEQSISNVVWDLSGRDDFLDLVRSIIVPRRQTLIRYLNMRLDNEIDRATQNPNTSVSYMDKLNLGRRYINEVSENAVLLSEYASSIDGSGFYPPPWFAATFAGLELSIWNTLVKNFEEVATIPNTPTLTISIAPGTLDVLKRERAIIADSYHRSMEQIRTDEWSRTMASNSIEWVLNNGDNEPSSWAALLNEFRELGSGDRSRQLTTRQDYPAASTGLPFRDAQTTTSMDTQRAYGTVAQAYPMASSQEATREISINSQPVIYAMAVPQQPQQKGYTKSGKKSHGYGKVAKKSPVYNSFKNSRGMATIGGEILNSVQKEYSRRNPKTVKPVYHKTPDFRPK